MKRGLLNDRSPIGIAMAAFCREAPIRRLAEYQPYWAARAALLLRAGGAYEAADAYRRAIGLESDPSVRHFLQDQLAESIGHLAHPPAHGAG